MRRIVTSSIAPLSLAALLACSSSADHGKPNLTVTIAGEGAALTGFPFPAAANEPSFVDGWDVRFERILVTVDDIALSDNPDMSPTDQSVTGAVLARAHGPWAVDMTRPGAPTDIRTETDAITPLGGDHGSADVSENPNAQALVRLQSLDDSRSFDPSVRYGFNFDFVPATNDAKKTNLDAAAEADYAEMVQKGWAVLYVGTATFKGVDCKSSDAASPEAERYDFTRLPKTVKFRFGFHTPTKYVNCQNSSLKGRAFDGEESQRGVQLRAQGETVAQITLHVDHPFWSTVDHDAAELYFDQIAAVATPDGTVTLEDLATVDFTSFKDRAGKKLPWRSCIAEKAPKEGTRKFDSGSVPVNPQASPDAALRNYGDYVHYQQSTEGHLNADGLCAVKRLFPAPR